MEIFLIVVLFIVVFVIWRGSQNTMEQLRGEIDGLQRDVRFLQDKLAALLKPQAATPPAASTPAPAPSPARKPDISPLPVPPPQPFPPAPPLRTAAHPMPPPSVAAFKQTTPVAPVPPSMPAKAPQPTASFQPVSAPIEARSMPHPPLIAPTAAQPEPSTNGSGGLFALEQRLGANWLNKLGIAILVIGLAFFLAYKLQTWGPEGKVFCGFGVSFSLLAGGVWLERKVTYPLPVP